MATNRIIKCILLFLVSIQMPVYSKEQKTISSAYHLAADINRIPVVVLYAIAMQESGYKHNDVVAPYPWALNVAGKPYRLRTQAEACVLLQKSLTTTSAKRIDVGIAQINIGYFRQTVTQPCDLLEPYLNLYIASKILSHHYKASQNWLSAIGRYHRPAGGKPAERYRHQVKKHLSILLGKDLSKATTLEF